jgi:hypothetical protein
MVGRDSLVALKGMLRGMWGLKNFVML